MQTEAAFRNLAEQIEGELHSDISTRLIYATDASVYREIPAAVALPKNPGDIKSIIAFAHAHKISLIPRAAGTSLAGQVVGSGIIVDISKYLNRILELNTEEQWVRVEPGVVPDELNAFLRPHGLFFAPETSTSNRCNIGGMIGNNSCGAHSLIYGSTRDHLLELECILSDGSEVVFRSLSDEEFITKCKGDSLEDRIFRNIRDILSKPENRAEIVNEFPDPQLKRRNTGYAIDLLLKQRPFNQQGEALNLCTLLAGSEGTLAFTTAAKLKLIPLPPPHTGLLCVHFKTLEEALQANLIALSFAPGSIELMDNFIINATRDNLSQKANRFFIQGEPGAILIIEWARESIEEVRSVALATEQAMRDAGLGYHFPLITGTDQKKVWNLRKAGLGVLTNIPGDAKPTGVIEDTAVKPELLPAYIADLKTLFARHGLNCVYYAHIATGELHMKPVLNLKTEKDHTLFTTVARETAALVKKYRGSLSGEHGDGRLRGQYIPIMIGQHNYELVRSIKDAWDPAHIFNPGKILETPPADSCLRFAPGHPAPDIPCFFDHSVTQGLLRALEQCNGSADCRKSVKIGGVMCPSYMATGDEHQSTRARANLMREFFTHPDKDFPYANRELYDILDLCLSCKACKAECPSGIDMARYKAEFLQKYYDARAIPLRVKMVANISKIYRIFSATPRFFNLIATSHLLSYPVKKIFGFSVKRKFPRMSTITLREWVRRNPSTQGGKRVFLFADEFTNYTDAYIGIKAVKLLRHLGYDVVMANCSNSGRAQISNGLLREARRIAESNVLNLMLHVSEEHPLIGIEPSAILCFRDEYPDLVSTEMRETAKQLACNCLTIEEFIAREFKEGNIVKDSFTNAPKKIKLHGHCYQKALTSTNPAIEMLSIPENYRVEEIPSGCCGMAGSFGYEKEHYELSMKIGELVLFDAVRAAGEGVIIAAPGTSCRQHIYDGTDRRALHPVEILFDALW